MDGASFSGMLIFFDPNIGSPYNEWTKIGSLYRVTNFNNTACFRLAWFSYRNTNFPMELKIWTKISVFAIDFTLSKHLLLNKKCYTTKMKKLILTTNFNSGIFVDSTIGNRLFLEHVSVNRWSTYLQNPKPIEKRCCHNPTLNFSLPIVPNKNLSFWNCQHFQSWLNQGFDHKN